MPTTTSLPLDLTELRPHQMPLGYRSDYRYVRASKRANLFHTLVVAALIVRSAPSLRAKSSLSSAMSTAITSVRKTSPPNCQRPRPPMPNTATRWPGLMFADLIAR